MRLITLGNYYEPLVHDILKTLTILAVIEVVTHIRTGDKLLDKAFIRQTLYNLAGVVVFYLLVDPVIGSAGSPCCSLRKIVGMEKKVPVTTAVETPKEE